MTNDISTLNGSLKELGELMAANLTEQGVPSTYDEGLTTLANKIRDIGSKTLTLTSNKNILSYVDNETATLSATLLKDGRPISNKTIEFFSGATSLGTSITNSNGIAEKTYTSTGVGDIEIYAKVDTLVTEIFALQDCYRYDSASSDKTSSYGACITYRGSGTTTWSYSSNNGYRISIVNTTEGMVTLSELTGKDDFTVEFDVQMLNFSSSGISSAIGLCAYEDNNNYSRISVSQLKTTQRISVNGSASESEDNFTHSLNSNQLVHFKYTITDNKIVEEISQGTTVNGTRTISYTPTSNTKFGICGIWQKTWAENNYFKNIKVKPL